MEFEGIIFDCDGTLTDSMPAHYRAWKTTMAAHGAEFPEHRFYELAGLPSIKVAAVIADENGKALDLDAIVKEREAAFDAQASQVAANVPIVELADQFRRSVPISVASGSLRPSVHAQLKGLKIYDWFAAIVCAEDTDRHKPEPDVFLMAAEKMKVPAGRCCVYEDGDLGIEAAHRAGMQVVDVRPILERWKTAFENTDPSNR